MALALPAFHIIRKDNSASAEEEEYPPSTQTGLSRITSSDRTDAVRSSTRSSQSTQSAGEGDGSSDDYGDGSDNQDTLDATAAAAAAAAPVAACETPTLTCEAGQIRVLSISQDSCQWSCQRDPYYKKARDNKGSVIGGSVGATAGVLLVLLAILLFTQARKRRRERAAYDKDTADLASELSDVPLMRSVERQGSQQHQQQQWSSTSVPSSTSDGGSRLASVFGIGGSRGSDWLVPRAPHPDEAGTELTMDIVDRPPENDPTLAVLDGSLPYRQEKTAAAYPLLAEFSHEGAVAASESGSAKQQTAASVSPEAQLLHNYEVARYSADAAIAAARESALAGTPVMASFNPFNAVPSVRSLPYDDDGSQPTVSRKHSDRSNKSSV
ncbi:hypothetical protein H4R99_003316 [Coemansia sp. RSA 1722]|nr:hypothetical protein IWW45_001980 [Coemansia sp. RSA 485]KAJ2600523.1 hypothetical protein H4R99_003316 [Coemansia sp. RSA 1722]